MTIVKRIAAVGTVLCAAAVAACGSGGSDDGSATAAESRFDAKRAFADLRAQVRIGPRPSGSTGGRREVGFLERRLREAGVREVRVQRPHRNVVGTIPGNDPGAIVIGAHHDTKDGIPGFVGANDGASGVAVVLELARALAPEVEGPSVQVALFDAEEARGDRPFALDGARGSAQYVQLARRGGRQGSPALAEIEAMVLFDMVGDCDLQIPRERSSDGDLYEAFEAAGERAVGERSPFGGETGAILDDHRPFAEAGVPALDLIDFTFGPGQSPGAFWHTPDDTLDKVCPESLAAVGAAALEALPEIG